MPQLSNEAMELWAESHLAEENNLAPLPTHAPPPLPPLYITLISHKAYLHHLYMPSTKMTSFMSKEEEAGALILKYTSPKIEVSSTYAIKKQVSGAGKLAQG